MGQFLEIVSVHHPYPQAFLTFFSMIDSKNIGGYWLLHNIVFAFVKKKPLVSYIYERNVTLILRTKTLFN